MASHNRKTNIREVNFDKGDYVLRPVAKRAKTHKLVLKWRGLFRVICCKSDYAFLVEDLSNGDQAKIHGFTLKLFQNKVYEVKQDILDHIAFQNTELMFVHNLMIFERLGSHISCL